MQDCAGLLTGQVQVFGGLGGGFSLDLVPALAQVAPARSLFQLTKLSQPHLSPQHGRNNEKSKEEKALEISPWPSVSQHLQFRKCQPVEGTGGREAQRGTQEPHWRWVLE